MRYFLNFGLEAVSRSHDISLSKNSKEKSVFENSGGGSANDTVSMFQYLENDRHKMPERCNFCLTFHASHVQTPSQRESCSAAHPFSRRIAAQRRIFYEKSLIPLLHM
jgi:hypothetical protein